MIDVPFKFARIFSTPTLGQVVLVDDPANILAGARTDGPSVTSDHTRIAVASAGSLGYYEIFCADSTSICRHMLPRNPLTADMIGGLLKLDEDLQGSAIEKLLIAIHKQSGPRGIEFLEAMRNNDHTPFAKIFQSESYGQILAIRDGKMELHAPHIAIRWRPDVPHLHSPLTIMGPQELIEGKPNQLNLDAVREKLLEIFSSMSKEDAEEMVRKFLKSNRKHRGPVFHFNVA